MVYNKINRQQIDEKKYGVSSAGLTMWQMWQMPRASGGPPEVDKFFSARK